MKDDIDVNSLDKCSMCFKDFKTGDEVVSLCLYDEIIEKGPKSRFRMRVKEAYQLTAYHKRCSPFKINKGMYKKRITWDVTDKK